jgi:hypothetical protein
MSVSKNIEDVRGNVLEIAADLHEEFKNNKDIKTVSEALKAYNISVNTAKAQLVYGKVCGFGSKAIDFLEPKK